MTVKLANNATSKLASSISSSSTTLSLLPGDGAKFPALSGGDTFPVTLVKASGQLEICRCTARSSDVLTVIRGQENTSAKTFEAGDRIELRLTEGAFEERIAESSKWANITDKPAFGTAATLNAVTSTADATAGRLLVAGSGGLLGEALEGANLDDNLLPSGFYSNVSASGTMPHSGFTGSVLVIKRAARPSQLALSYKNGQTYFRSYTSQGWDPWVEIYHSGNPRIPWLSKVVGEEFAILDAAPKPPTDDPDFRFVVLTAGLTGSGGYNEGVLTDETVTGSDPTITATAKVSLVGSPLDGMTIDLINTSRVFLRPGEEPGPIVDSQNAAHIHTGTANSAGAHSHTIRVGQGIYASSYAHGSNTTAGNSSTLSAGAHTHTLTIASSGGDEAHPRYIPRTYYMRIL